MTDLPVVPDDGDGEQADAGGFDFGSLLEQAQQMQSQLLEAQANMAQQVHEGSSGGGAVHVTVTGGMEFLRIKIRKDAVDPDDVEMLEDLVLAALHDAVAKVNEAQQATLGGFMPPGMDGLLGQ